MNSRVCAYIDIDNIMYNLESMKSNIAENTKIMAVVKTNAYGHGANLIAAKIEPIDYIAGFAVATVSEAVALREEGIKKPVLVLGFTFPEDYEQIVKYDIRPAVFKADMAKALSDEAVKQGKNVYFHVKVDTGMGRIGVRCDETAVELVKEILSLPNVVSEGIFTHFAKADMTNKEPTFLQMIRFKDFIERLKEENISFDIHHCSNSAGIIRFKEANMDMVRAGITLYGLWPSDETERNIIDLKPVMSLKSHIAYIKTLDEGETVSYGGLFIAEQPVKIATIPVGYGDGYPRSLSNKGYVLIRGQKAYIKGRVCMDQFMVDVTGIEGVSEYDEVTLIGCDGEEEITMETLGDLSGRFNYELACDIGQRVPRILTQNSEI